MIAKNGIVLSPCKLYILRTDVMGQPIGAFLRKEDIIKHPSYKSDTQILEVKYDTQRTKLSPKLTIYYSDGFGGDQHVSVDDGMSLFITHQFMATLIPRLDKEGNYFWYKVTSLELNPKYCSNEFDELYQKIKEKLTNGSINTTT